MSLNEDDRKFFSFTATTGGVLSVSVVADGDGPFAEVEVKDLTTAAGILEIEPYDSAPRRTSSLVGIVAGRTYASRVKAPFETLAVAFTVASASRGRFPAALDPEPALRAVIVYGVQARGSRKTHASRS